MRQAGGDSVPARWDPGRAPSGDADGPGADRFDRDGSPGTVSIRSRPRHGRLVPVERAAPGHRVFLHPPRQPTDRRHRDGDAGGLRHLEQRARRRLGPPRRHPAGGRGRHPRGAGPRAARQPGHGDPGSARFAGGVLDRPAAAAKRGARAGGERPLARRRRPPGGFGDRFGADLAGRETARVPVPPARRPPGDRRFRSVPSRSA